MHKAQERLLARKKQEKREKVDICHNIRWSKHRETEEIQNWRKLSTILYYQI